jgi:hypothetical protein
MILPSLVWTEDEESLFAGVCDVDLDSTGTRDPFTMLRVSQLATAPVPTTTPTSPPARRLTLHRWRDPRLWVGLVLVTSSVLVGARLLAAADDSVGVWAVTRDVTAGVPLTHDAVVVRQVHFADPATAAAYLQAARPLPTGAVLSRDVSAGELLTSTALTEQQDTALELPVVVGPAGAPADLATGDAVDVWVGPPAGAGLDTPAERMLTGVPVVGAARSSGPFGEAATRQVVLGIDAGTVEALGPLLGQISSGSVVLVRHGLAR